MTIDPDLDRQQFGFRDITHHQFDIHLSHACNFSCDSCSHYSQFHFSGNLSLEEAEAWYKKWSARIHPFKINLLGGEPALNPHLGEHILLARRYWPNAELYLYTNGFLLHRHPTLPQVIRDVGNFVIRLSRHYDAPDYTERFEDVVTTLRSWESQYGTKLEVMDSYSRWTRRYLDQDGKITPFQDNNPRLSWEICNAKWCLQLHEGKLWKCPILAYLPMVKQRYGVSDEWAPSLAYKPLEADCSDDELHEFLARREESYCSACPAYKRSFPKNDPTKMLRRTPQPA
jgi:organic radical activating enzyme